MKINVIFRFNMIEIALALVILAIGLSSVLVLFPIGLNAGKSSVAENNLADVAEQVVAFLQSELTVPAHWKEDGAGATGGVDIAEFDADPSATAIGAMPDVSEFNEVTVGSDSKKIDGLLSCTKVIDGKTYYYYLYRQYANVADDSDAADSERAVDFEAMIRVGLDTASLKEQYYPVAGDSGDAEGQRQLKNYTRPGKENERVKELGGNLLDVDIDKLLKKCYKTVIVEISWPADAPWAKREKRIFRLEMFNENFVPYPQNTSSGS